MEERKEGVGEVGEKSILQKLEVEFFFSLSFVFKIYLFIGDRESM